MPEMTTFAFESDAIDLPAGAWAKTHRRTLGWRGRDILALTQGRRRAYVYPLYTPAGFAVTTESPADHPHHNSLWIASDHLHCLVPADAGKIEEYTYNFYVDETFQGRAPGSIRETGLETGETADGAFRIEQALDWVGPVEWAADGGRTVMTERRTLTVRPGEAFHVIDIRSTLTPTDWDVTFGPTRHAFFNFRVAESMRGARGGRLIDAEGRSGGGAVTGGAAAWVDYTGPLGGGLVAGIAMGPKAGIDAPAWFATDWGTVTLQPFRHVARKVSRGETLAMAVRLVVHDGALEPGRLDALFG
jgi:hypothetical protein